jgi:hypothetical protein
VSPVLPACLEIPGRPVLRAEAATLVLTNCRLVSTPCLYKIKVCFCNAISFANDFMFGVLRAAVCIEIVGKTGGRHGAFSRVFRALVLSRMDLVHTIDNLP